MQTKDLVVVGIGSSAGGLEALQIMLAKLSNIQNCAYIIAQHLSPTHKSMMVELLSRVTNIPVVEIQNGMVIKSKTVYMTPENTDIYISNGRIYLKSIEQTYGPKPSVNFFFNSLAQNYGERAIGIILSGTGSDGAFGIRAIKASGGITIAQSPSTAKYDGMPVSAINTGKVDIVIPIDSIASEIERIIGSFGKNVGETINETMVAQIYRLLFEEKGVDFSQYKKSTLVRRIERRLAALKIETLIDYIDYIKSNNDEITNLYNDILIGVTEFFRDKESFEFLTKYIKELVDKKEQGEEIRFWSVGCSTGEEAYTLAILLCEILKDKISRYKIKIFATDIDDESLKIARTGIYAETSLVNMPKIFVQRYFTLVKNHFEVKKSIRELVIFSKHNIVSDSPFLRLDLISCRNMLIYFNQSLQNRFFPIAHYALKQDGLLFLGKSESVGQNSDIFISLDKKEKLFKAQYIGIKEPPRLYNYALNYKSYTQDRDPSKFKNEEQMLDEKVTEAAKEYILDKCVLVNSSNDIVYVKGEIPYMIHAQGRASNNIFKSIKEDLVLDLRSAINEAQKNKEIKITHFRSLTIIDNVTKYVRILVIPIRNDNGDDWFYALFFQSENIEHIQGVMLNPGNDSETVEKLQDELIRTKSHLQNVIEELETSYEEMQSLNEELSSSNEELQSSNEELETTNEELQSTNEELQTAYSELKVFYDDKDNKAKQLEEFANMLKVQTEDYRKQKELNEAIINTTPIAITMVDKNGKLNFVNERAQKLFNLSKKELLTRSFDSIRWNITDFHGNPLSSEALPFTKVKKSFASVYNIEHAIETADGKKHFLSVSGAPLFDASGDFLGAVFSLDDITDKIFKAQQEETTHASAELALAKELALGYENLKQLDVNTSLSNQFNFIQIAMLDISANIKNRLNTMSLNLQAVAAKDVPQELREELVNDLEQNIEAMNLLMEQNTLFYNEVLLGNTIELERLLRRVMQLCYHSLQENKIEIVFERMENLSFMVNPKSFSPFLLLLLSALIEVKNVYFKEQELEVHIQKEELKESKALAFVFQGDYNAEVNQDALVKFAYSVKEYAHINGKKLSLVLEEKVKILMELP